MKVLITESQLNRLYEIGGGVHSDGQLDMFLEPHEMNSFRKNGNEKFLNILKEIERECGWTHDSNRDIDKGDYIIHQCYPLQYFYTKEPVPRYKFVERLSEKIPSHYLNTSYPRTTIRPEDWYVKVSIKKV